MNAKPKTNSVVTSRVRDDGVLEITVLRAGPTGENGQPTNAVLTLDPAAIHEDNRRRAMYMGLTSRIVDKAALPFDKAKGRYATPAEKLEAMRPLVEHLASGTADWSPKRATVVKVSGLDAILLAAVQEATGRGEAEVREMVAKGAGKHHVTEEQFLALLGRGKLVAPIVERMRAEQAASVDLDADDLLDEAMGAGQEDEERPSEPYTGGGN